MKEVFQKYYYDASSSDIYEALCSEKKISQWLTHTVILNAKTGEESQLEWRGHKWSVDIEHGTMMMPTFIEWICRRAYFQNTNAWQGTIIRFYIQIEEDDYSPHKGKTRLILSQSNYRESPCFEKTLQFWDYYLGHSLKKFLETGVGDPY